MFHRDYENPRTTTFNVGYEQELAPDVAAYADYTYARGAPSDAVHQLQPAPIARAARSARSSTRRW